MAQHPLPSVGDVPVMVQIGPVRAAPHVGVPKTTPVASKAVQPEFVVRTQQREAGNSPAEPTARAQIDGDGDTARRNAWGSIPVKETSESIWFRRNKSRALMPDHTRALVESVTTEDLGYCWTWVDKYKAPYISPKRVPLPADPTARNAAIQSAVNALIDKLVAAKIDPLP